MQEPLSFHAAFGKFKDTVKRIISENSLKNVCEIGGGRSPLFNKEEIEELNIDYTILDISEQELEKAPSYVNKICCDISNSNSTETYDIMFSKMVCEHVRDGRRMHANVFKSLKAGGHAFHLFPSLVYPAFVINKIIGENISRNIIINLFPERHDKGSAPKFRAYYSWCYGPTSWSKLKFIDLGYEIVSYQPFYGSAYFERLPIINLLEWAATSLALKFKNPYYCSFVYLHLRKP